MIYLGTTNHLVNDYLSSQHEGNQGWLKPIAWKAIDPISESVNFVSLSGHLCQTVFKIFVF